jgi:hypothetical protein
MDPASLVLAGLIWLGNTDIAVSRAEIGPWQMNESRWDYVDDATVAFDARGAIAVAWVDQGRKDVFFRRLDSKEPVNVSRSPKIFSWLPRLAIDARGTIFILWQEIVFSGGSHGGDILFSRSEDAGNTFSHPVNLSDSRAGDGKGRINRDLWHNGSLDLIVNETAVHVAWTEYEGALWLRRSTDGGKSFSPKIRVSEARPARAPALAVQGNNVYLAWTVGDDPSADIRVAKSADGGASFAAPVIVERTKGYSDAPKLAVDREGTLHLAYGESERGLFAGRHVRYARSTDGARSFETPRNISGADAGFPALGIDGKGNVYVLWERFAGETLRPRGLGIAVSSDGGRSFRSTQVPESIGAGSNGSLQGMLTRKLAVGTDGALAVVNSSIHEREGSRVWLVRGKLSQ